MKKTLFGLIILITLLIMKTTLIIDAYAPYNTKTLGPENNLVWTQTAYMPVGILNQDVDLSQPEDIFLYQNKFYIADKNNSRVVILDEDGYLYDVIGENVLDTPTGIYVSDDGSIYVADPTLKGVFKFNHNDELIFTYNRPEEPLFGKTNPYQPTKVVVDRRGNLYIIGEGATDGVIQLNYAGDFLGYYGVNTTQVSIEDQFADWFLGEENRLADKLPPSPANIALDNRDLVYTATHNVPDSLKKLNIQGLDRFGGGMYYPEGKIQDIYVGNNNNVFAITDEAIVYEYDRKGNLLFSFGGLDNGNQRLGLLKTPSGIVSDQYGNLYILDSGYNNIQIYQKTKFVEIVHKGLNLYDLGDYEQSVETWTEVLKMNSSFALAHSNLGKSYFKQFEYEDALNEFKIANDKQGYSDAYWKIRHEWLQNNLGTTILVLLLIYVLIKIIKTIHERTGFLDPVLKVIRKITSIKIISEILLLFSMFKHPLDTFYEIKHRKKASYQSALFWLAILFIEYLIFVYNKSFIFNTTDLENVSLLIEFAKIVGIFFLWTFSNYLVSTLSDGEGWFRDVFIGSIYSLAPLIVGLIPITIVSNFFTFNEIFIYTFSIQVVVAWSFILLFFMVKDIHNYSVKDTIKNILITLFGMLIIALILFIVYMLINQLIDFVVSVVKEVIARARYT